MTELSPAMKSGSAYLCLLTMRPIETTHHRASGGSRSLQFIGTETAG